MIKTFQDMVDFFVFQIGAWCRHWDLHLFPFRIVFFDRQILVCWAMQEGFRGKWSSCCCIYYKYTSFFDRYPSSFRLCRANWKSTRWAFSLDVKTIDTCLCVSRSKSTVYIWQFQLFLKFVITLDYFGAIFWRIYPKFSDLTQILHFQLLPKRVDWEGGKHFRSLDSLVRKFISAQISCFHIPGRLVDSSDSKYQIFNLVTILQDMLWGSRQYIVYGVKSFVL